jgi:hypothetical protein
MRDQLIKQVAEELMHPNNTVSTLEVKLELRRKYPAQFWFQHEVSKVMNDLYLKGLFDYSDTGSFRVYSLVKAKPTPVAQATPAPSRKAKAKLSRSKALELIQGTGGRFFGVTFTKKDGSVRKMRCKIDKDHLKPSTFGYLTVVDVAEGTPKSLNLQTLSEVRVNKTTYKVG